MYRLGKRVGEIFEDHMVIRGNGRWLVVANLIRKGTIKIDCLLTANEEDPKNPPTPTPNLLPAPSAKNSDHSLNEKRQ